MTPIVGLTNRGLSFPEIGRIRKGQQIQVKNRPGVTRPVDLKWFRVQFDQAENKTEALFVDIYSTQPTEIDIILPFDKIDECWDAWLEAYQAGRMIFRSDGKKIDYWIDSATGAPKVKNGVAKEGVSAEYLEGMVVGYTHGEKPKPIFAKPRGRLKVIVPTLRRAAYLTLITGSWADCQNISQELEALKTINGGRLAGIPLRLVRKPRMVSCPNPNDPTQRVRMEKWLCFIEADPRWVEAQMTHLNQLAMPDVKITLLPAETGTVVTSQVESSESEEAEDQVEETGEEQLSAPKEPEPPAEFVDGITVQINDEIHLADLAKAANPVTELPPLRSLEHLRTKIQSTKTAFDAEGMRLGVNTAGLVVTCMEKALDPAGGLSKDTKEERRHAVLQALTGKTSMKELAPGEVYALYKWLLPQKVLDEWLADDRAVREIQSFWAQINAQPTLEI